MRSVLTPILLPLAAAAAVGCNLALGLGGYDFAASSGGHGGASTSSSTASSSTSEGGSGGGTTSSTGGATTTSQSTSSSTTSGTGGQGGSLPSGEVAWSREIAMSPFEIGGVAKAASGHVYVGGQFSASGTAPIVGCPPLSAPNGSSAAFLIELNELGQCVAARAFSAGAANVTMSVSALAVSKTGEIAMAIAYVAPVTLPSGDMLPAPVNVDAAVVLYPPNADILASAAPTWIRPIGATGDQVVTDLAFDDDGDVWAAGSYTTSLVTGTNNAFTKNGIPKKTGFVLRLDAAKGEPDASAVRLFATTSNDDVEALAAAAKGSRVAAGGKSRGGLDFGAGPVAAPTLNDGYFALFDAPEMSFVGGAALGDSFEQAVLDLAFSPAGDLYLSGWGYGTLGFPSGVTLSLGNTTRTFLAQIAPSGAALKGIAIGDADTKSQFHVAVLPGSGDVVFAGMMKGNVGLPGAPPLTAPTQGNDVVVGRIDPMLSSGRWLKAWGDGPEQGADALALGPEGEIVIAGHCDGALFGAPQGGVRLFVAQINP
jgi:hypothetical protein